jgi:hypothetical protein
MPALLPQWESIRTPLIGVLHLPPLPGSPGAAGIERAIAVALNDARALVEGGAHGLIVENFGDAPFYPRRVPAHVTAAMTRVAAEVRRACERVPLGINVLRNDGRSALAVASAVGAEFIRVNILCGARVTDQGVIQGIAHALLRDRATLGAGHIRILADVDVKHSAPLGPSRPVEQEVADLLHRGRADGVIVTGLGTGRPVDPEMLTRVREAAGGAPVLVGSGVTAANVAEYRDHCDGLIVGTGLKRDGIVSAAVDAARVGELVRSLAAW